MPKTLGALGGALKTRVLRRRLLQFIRVFGGRTENVPCCTFTNEEHIIIYYIYHISLIWRVRLYMMAMPIPHHAWGLLVSLLRPRRKGVGKPVSAVTRFFLLMEICCNP